MVNNIWLYYSVLDAHSNSVCIDKTIYTAVQYRNNDLWWILKCSDEIKMCVLVTTVLIAVMNREK